MELNNIRVEIDSLDRQIIELFKRRMDCSVKVAESKRESGTPILNPEREKVVLNRAEELGGEYGKYARLLYGSIMELSRDLQHTIINGDSDLKKIITSAESEFNAKLENCNVACLGGTGSNSHLAAMGFFPNANYSLEKNFDKVFEAVAGDKCDFGVLPV
ncbi:MAG: chorismate mutase, partial [Clostridia bacterium]|nr:chorismate mutase [Clostridia bacterium]